MKKSLSAPLASTPAHSQVLGTFKGFTMEVCMTEASKRTAYRLRYRAYLAVDAIPENPQRMLHDAFDASPNSRTFLVWFEGKPVATVRSCVYSDAYQWMKTEAVDYFAKDVYTQLGEQTRIVESNRFAVDPDFQGRQSLFARLLLFRAHGLNAGAHECAYIMTSVRSNHVKFYQRFLGLVPISTESCYVEWADAEVSLLANPADKCLGLILEKGMPPYDQDDIIDYAVKAHIPIAREYQTAA